LAKKAGDGKYLRRPHEKISFEPPSIDLAQTYFKLKGRSLSEEFYAEICKLTDFYVQAVPRGGQNASDASSISTKTAEEEIAKWESKTNALRRKIGVEPAPRNIKLSPKAVAKRIKKSRCGDPISYFIPYLDIGIAAASETVKRIRRHISLTPRTLWLIWVALLGRSLQSRDIKIANKSDHVDKEFIDFIVEWQDALPKHCRLRKESETVRKGVRDALKTLDNSIETGVLRRILKTYARRGRLPKFNSKKERQDQLQLVLSRIDDTRGEP
jgi:hypothetical protein